VTEPGDEYSTDPVRKKRDHRELALILAFVSAAALVFAAFSQQWLHAERTQLQSRNGELVIVVGGIHEVGFGLRSRFLCEPDGPCNTMTNAELMELAQQVDLRTRFMLHEPVDDELKQADPAGYAAAVHDRDELDSPDNVGHDREVAELTATKHVSKFTSAFWVFGWVTLVAISIAALSLVLACVMVLAKREFVWPVMPSTTALLAIAVALISGCVFAALKPGPAGYVGVGIGFLAFGIGVVSGLWSSVMLAKLLRPADPDLLEDSMNPDQF
jgi:hypothetical protein